jgi:hypothetical protein
VIIGFFLFFLMWKIFGAFRGRGERPFYKFPIGKRLSSGAFFWACFARPKKPGFPLQVLGPPYGGPVGFPLQSLARAQRPIHEIAVRQFRESVLKQHA